MSGRPEGRPRLKRVLKDAGAPPSFRTDLQPRPGFSPCDHPSQPLNDVFQHRASARAAGPAGPACRKQARSLVFPCRGLPPPDRPLLLFTPELRTRQLLALYRSGGLNLAHAVAVPPAALAARDWTSLKRLVFEENDGFWLAPDEAPGLGKRVSLDSLGRLLRRLAR